MKCPQCGRDLGPTEDGKYCAFCGSPIPDAAPDSGNDQIIIESGDEGDGGFHRVSGYCPWEDQDNLGLFRGLFFTIKDSLIKTDQFFSAIPIGGGLLQPLLFALIVETLGAVIKVLWAFQEENPFLVQLDLSGAGAVAVGILIPILIFGGIFVWAFLIHASLFLTGSAKQPVEATFRVVCYSSGPEFFSIIPIVGGIVAFWWKLYLTVVGLKEVHRISLGKAILALSLPVLL
ncbi:MAG: YIP1 family protein, partial [Pseudomonadota bacterium]